MGTRSKRSWDSIPPGDPPTLADETEPVDPSEHLLRRIHRNAISLGMITTASFRPNERDTDGLSFFRDGLTTAEAVAAAAKSPGDNFVVRLPAAAVLAITMDVGGLEPAEMIGQPPGHCLVPQLTPDLKRTNKAVYRNIVKRLADLAQRDGEIVIEPDPTNST